MILKFIKWDPLNGLKVLFEQEVGLGFELKIEDEKKLREKFDDKDIESYNIEFCEGTKVKETHNLSNIKPSQIKQLTIKIKA